MSRGGQRNGPGPRQSRAESDAPKAGPSRGGSAHLAQPRASPLPPDRAGILTETRHPRTRRLHELDAGACVRLFAREDAAALAAVRRAGPALTRFIEAVAPRFEAAPARRRADGCSPGRLIYLGAGTSGRLGVLDASEAPPTFQIEPGRIVGIIAGGDGALRRSSEGAEDDPDGALPALRALRLHRRDSVLGIAAGGTTPYVRGALAHAKKLTRGGALTGLLTCAPVRPPEGCDHLIVLATGPEVLTGSTRLKAGTATKLALNTLSTTLMVLAGRVYENLMVDLRATNAKLRDRAARIVAELTGLEREDSFALLDRAGGEVKVAVVMHRLGETPAGARRRLARARGRLDAVLRAP